MSPNKCDFLTKGIQEKEKNAHFFTLSLNVLVTVKTKEFAQIGTKFPVRMAKSVLLCP